MRVSYALVLSMFWSACGDPAGDDGLAPDAGGAGRGTAGRGSAGNGTAGTAASDPTRPEPPTGGTGEDGSGQTGSIGQTPICDAAQCEAEAQGMADTLAAPAGWSRTFVGGSCQMVGLVGVAEGMACICDTGDGGSIFVGPEGAGCFAFGRAGDCLWDDSEFAGCSAGAGDPCDEMCGELEARYAADAAAELDVEVRHSECGAEGYCHSVLRIDEDCYADRSYENGQAFDCALRDDAILAQYLESQEPAPVPDCDVPDADPSGGTCTEPAPTPDDCVPRPEGEWQANRVCGPYPPCERPDGCGLALACIDGTCSACTSDAQCAPGEGCAIDHCLLLANIECHRNSDCSGDALCALSGYTGGTARSNEDMRAYCLSPSGGAAGG